MRRIIVEQVEKDKTVTKRTAWFHEFGLWYEDYGTGMVPYSVAIVEYDDGAVDTVPAIRIRFVVPYVEQKK